MLLNNMVLSPKAPYSTIPDYMLVDFEALPYEVELTTSLLQNAVSAFLLLFFGFITLGTLLAPIGLGLPNYFFLLCFGSMTAWGGLRLYKAFKYSRRIIFTPDHVRIRFGANKVSVIPYSEFKAIRASTIMSHWGRSVYVHQIYELVHPVRRLTVPVCITFRADNVEPVIRQLAKRFDLPIWRRVFQGWLVQEPADLDRPLADKVIAGDISTKAVLSSPPPGIHIRSSHVDGEEIINIRIDKTGLSYWTPRIFMMLFMFACYAATFWQSVLFGIIAVVVSLPFWIVGIASNFRKFEELELKGGVLAANGNQKGNMQDDVDGWRESLDNATELYINSEGLLAQELVLVCGVRIHKFGQVATTRGVRWLYDYLIYYIRERYVPDAGQTAIAPKSSSLGANQ